MSTTLSKISELCARDYARKSGRETVKPSEIALAKIHVLQAVNKVLGLTTKEAGADVPYCMIATYRAISALSDGAVKYVDLPAQPLQLPLDKGVWEVSPDAALSAAYIPFPSAFRQLLEGEDAGLLEGQVGWIREGDRIYFTEDPAGTVKVKLLVADPATITDDDALPLSPELESDVYDMVIAKLFNTGKSIE